MDMTNQSPEPPEPSAAGIVRDARRLKAHGQATAAELREFLAQTRGRNTQEVLGMVAGSHLTRCIVLATVGAVLVVAIGTIVPWAVGRAAADVESPAVAAEAPPADETPRPETSLASTTAEADLTPSPADAQRAVDAMGLGDTMIADPDTNPLENNLDNLLDNLE